MRTELARERVAEYAAAAAEYPEGSFYRGVYIRLAWFYVRMYVQLAATA
jgi:hypothetical protein